MKSPLIASALVALCLTPACVVTTDDPEPVVLLDPSGRERTTTVGLGTFEIYGDDELILDIDFPPSSFY